MRILGVAALALIIASSAAAANPNPTAWSRGTMTNALKAIGYPRVHPKKLTCRGLGAADTTGRYMSFRCAATYTHHRVRRFYAAGEGEGGWLCAGTTVAGCKLLRHGFIPTSTWNLGGALDIAARGYMTNKYGSYQALGFCKGGPPTWTCPFAAGAVTLTAKPAKGGYVTLAAG